MQPNKSSKSWRRTSHRAARTACSAGLAVFLAPFIAPAPAAAQEFRLNVEPAAAFWLDTPQADRFTPGFYLALRPGISLGSVVGLQWSYAMLLTPAGPDFTEDGSAHTLTAGVRVRPFGALKDPTEQLSGLWFDGNLGYARTGVLDRFGFDTGLGYNFQANDWMGLGPVVRYGQIVQPNDVAGVDPNDAQYLTVGLNLAFGGARKAESTPEAAPEAPAPVCPTVPEPSREPVACVAEACSDRDRDGVCDVNDRCPSQAGPAGTMGCPVDPCTGAPLVVLVQFAYDSAGMPTLKAKGPQTMDPVLDAVAKAIAQDPSCHVCVMGFASEEGAPAYNMDLSYRRAEAVQSYLNDRGLANTRIPTAGYGETCQLMPEESLELNRRVEFHRLQEGESCPKTCPQ